MSAMAYSANKTIKAPDVNKFGEKLRGLNQYYDAVKQLAS